MRLSRVFSRGIHLVPRLKNHQQWSQDGIKGLMSPKQYKTSWTDYQKFLTTNLTFKTIGTEHETRTPLAITLATAKKPELGPLFHYASQSHNNHLFFEQLQDASTDPPALKSRLDRHITTAFGSLENLRNDFLYAADILTGNGWVFLVETQEKTVKIISCNNDGTPYLYSRNQSSDLNGAISIDDFEKLISNKDRLSKKIKDYTVPLLVCNVWEHAYIEDYGVNGKADYLENFWNCINWEVVNNRLFVNIGL
ncbi:hypothetical protein KL921_000972 [Ogataea angusta]|uniref:Manganese/iron superoxide dismutase C-terminal domain-containing protein n=1 Tax=Pichia angusta TaxID=870730 RepID=A0ABQ7S3L8_PICAN|nr:hypothetical protein KL921_000972 [Ogataea angusta]KAG7832010.1 hypothetical protein KL920_000345 [Ogataea angusta]KAG7836182.1 hypothetical protein KL943_001831 [Ogataea angusta]KAG7843248.1 hypothetical protein KL942_000344 [Ogataea angusta]KAG7851466.1 hypothetical protein KL941_001135 [Ogataea angusta]